MKFLKNRNFKSSILSLVILHSQLAGAFSLTGQLIIHGSTNAYKENITQSSPSLLDMLNRYQIYRRIAYTKVMLTQGVEYTSKSIGTIGGALLTKGNPIVGAVAGQMLGDAIGLMGQSMRENIYNDMNKYLQNGLKEVVLGPSQIELTEKTGLPQDRARKLITNNPEIFNFEKLGARTSDERNLLESAAIEVLANKMAEHSYEANLQKMQIEAQREKIENLQAKSIEYGQILTKHIQTYRNFSVAITENMADLSNATQSLMNQVKINTKDIETNRIQIENVQSTLFNKMSDKEKIQSLQQGWFPELTNKDREEKIAILKEQSKIEMNLQIISTTAANLPAVLSLFTKDPKTLADVNKASQVVSGVMSVVASAGMGPFGMAMVGLGALGGILQNGSDNGAIEASRHQQVMESFKNVIDNQIKISQQISEVQISLAKGQEQIYELLKQTSQELVLLGKHIDQYHDEEMRHLNLVSRYTLANMDILRDLSGKDPSICHAFFGTHFGQVSEIRLFDQFESFLQLEKHFNSNKDRFKPCRAGLEYVLTKQIYDDDIHSLLLTKSYITELNENQMNWSTQKIYNPSRIYYESKRNKKDPKSYPDLIHVPALKNYVGLALELYPYLLLIKDTEALHLSTLEKSNPIDRYSIQRAQKILQASLTLINDAILQQEIIAGHYWIENLESEINSVQDKERKIFLRELLKNNPILQANLSRQIVHTRVKLTMSSVAYYNNLLSGQDPYPFFNTFFGNLFKPLLVDNQWKLDLGLNNESKDFFIELPSSETVVNQIWNYSEDMLDLHELRTKVINHLAWLNTM